MPDIRCRRSIAGRLSDIPRSWRDIPRIPRFGQPCRPGSRLRPAWPRGWRRLPVAVRSPVMREQRWLISQSVIGVTFSSGGPSLDRSMTGFCNQRLPGKADSAGRCRNAVESGNGTGRRVDSGLICRIVTWIGFSGQYRCSQKPRRKFDFRPPARYFDSTPKPLSHPFVALRGIP